MRIDYATGTIVMRQPVDRVFNFISRGAQYHRWHFDYHLRAEALDIRAAGVGSVFCIEEIIDGFTLRHVGHVVTLERNHRFVWRGRFALVPWIWIGTDFTFTPRASPGPATVPGGESTAVTEILYFELSSVLLPAALPYMSRRAFRRAACRQHILDELTGVKTMLEAGDHDPEDVTFAFDDPAIRARIKRYRTDTGTAAASAPSTQMRGVVPAIPI